MTSAEALTSSAACVVDVQAVAALVDLPGDKALPPQLVEHGNMIRRAVRTEMQAAEAIGPARLLRVRSERPCSRCAAEKPEKLAPFH